MDLGRQEALKKKAQAFDGIEHLFIDAGGFGPKNPAGWRSQWMVLKRK